MGVTVRFTPDRAGIRAVASAPFMQREVRRRALRIEAAAKVLAPVRTGHYRASIGTTAGVRAGGAYARITAGAFYSIWVEVGNSRGAPAQHIMRRAARAGGN